MFRQTTGMTGRGSIFYFLFYYYYGLLCEGEKGPFVKE